MGLFDKDDKVVSQNEDTITEDSAQPQPPENAPKTGKKGKNSKKNQTKDNKSLASKAVKLGKGATAALSLVMVAVFLFMFCTTQIPAGHTGVVTRFGKVKDYTLDSGLHFKAPWYSIVKMDNRVQKKSVELSCFSSDIQEVNVIYTLNFRIEKENAMKIYREIGKDYYDTVITPAIAESVKIVTAKYSAENLVSMRTELAQGIETDLSSKLAKYNVQVVSTAVEDMDFTDAFTDAVEQKQVAEQNKLRAQTEAEQKVIEAEAEAKVQLIQAEAEAEANKVISESLTDRILKKSLYEKWDGKMPTVTGGDSNAILPSDLFN